MELIFESIKLISQSALLFFDNDTISRNLSAILSDFSHFYQNLWILQTAHGIIKIDFLSAMYASFPYFLSISEGLVVIKA